MRYLVKGFGPENLDYINKSDGSTPLMVACDLLTDLIMIETLVEHGADVNAVNCNNGMPLNIIKARLK